MALLALCAWLALPAVAAADPGKAGSGNPHQEGASGNPHQDGASGKPHRQAKQETPAAPRARPEAKPQSKRKVAGTGNAKGRSNARKGGVKAKSHSNGRKGGRTDRPAPKTTLCHATGSETNPFVEITISDNALDAHRAHQNEEDVIPGSIGDCEQSPSTTNPPEDGKDGVTPPPGPQAPGLQPASEVGGQTQAAPPPTPAPPAGAPGETRVLGVTDESGAQAQPVSDDGDVAGAEQAAGAGDEDGALPFTGLRLAMLALIALASLLAGVSLRRAARPQM